MHTRFASAITIMLIDAVIGISGPKGFRRITSFALVLHRGLDTLFKRTVAAAEGDRQRPR